MSRRLAAQVVADSTGEVARAVTPLAGGQVGRVYRVDTPGRSLVVKFVTAAEDPPFADEPVDNRIYGSRWSNLGPARTVLAAHDLPIPGLFAQGDLETEGLRYAVMAYLAGDPDDHTPDWFSSVGRALGRAHQITRRYQGWVGLDAPLADDWSAAFEASLHNRFRDAEPLLGPDLRQAISAHLGRQLGRLGDPDRFVLSHTDGFQGVMKRSENGWACVGHIDVEDFQFTDPRFVLAGFELSHAFAGRSVPRDFWDGYLETASLAPDYVQVRSLFQAYYLLVWIVVLGGQPALADACRRRLADIAG